MECDSEEQAEQESEKVKTLSDPGDPSKREREDERSMRRLMRSTAVGASRAFEGEVSQ